MGFVYDKAQFSNEEKELIFYSNKFKMKFLRSQINKKTWLFGYVIEYYL